jgi:hypothetical protein
LHPDDLVICWATSGDLKGGNRTGVQWDQSIIALPAISNNNTSNINRCGTTESTRFVLAAFARGCVRILLWRARPVSFAKSTNLDGILAPKNAAFEAFAHHPRTSGSVNWTRYTASTPQRSPRNAAHDRLVLRSVGSVSTVSLQQLDAFADGNDQSLLVSSVIITSIECNLPRCCHTMAHQRCTTFFVGKVCKGECDSLALVATGTISSMRTMRHITRAQDSIPNCS